LAADGSAKKMKKILATENFLMIINFLNLSIDKLLEFNLVNKNFYHEIIPYLMLPKKKEKAIGWYKWSGARFDCSLRQRIVFMGYNGFYEIKELDHQMN
jgi:hypothetical protein